MSTSKNSAAAVVINQGEESAEVRTTAQPSAGSPDQYHGQGGSYLRDPETGERVLIERTGPCDCAGQAERNHSPVNMEP